MKPRLFCFGDSFVDWHIPKYHWRYYLSKHYEVYKHGKLGADNSSIIFQLGNLDEYREGDRIVIVFTDPGRLPGRYYGDKKELYLNNQYRSPPYYKDSKFAEKLDDLRLTEGNNWINGVRENDIKFLKNLQKWLKIYNPVFITWSEQFAIPTSDFVTLIKVTSNWEEGVGEKMDFHPGPKGCYEMYKIIHGLLEIEEPVVEFVEDIKDKKIL
jgi:hypothetical protein